MNQFDETYRKALAGDADAMYNLAWAYFSGSSTPADPVQFFKWAENGAKAGHAGAMFYLALAYLYAKGTPGDSLQFFVWTKKAAEAGDANAMYNLAWAYRYGIGTSTDLTRYFEWTRNAANSGSVNASMLNHAHCVLRDGGVDPTDILSSIDELLTAVHRIKQRHILGDGSKSRSIEIAHFTHLQTLEKCFQPNGITHFRSRIIISGFITPSI